jgi:hypothetical protein
MQNHYSAGRFLALPNYVMLLLILMLGMSVGCKGQEPQKPSNVQVKTIPDSILPKNLPTPPHLTARVMLNENPAREGGFVFIDSKEKEVGFLSEKELNNRNPYSKNSLASKKLEGDDFYNQFKGLSPEEIRMRLPKGLKSLPSDLILKNAGVITTNLTSYDFNQDNSQFLVVTYSIVIYNKQSLEEEWVETTIHVYDKQGVLISTIVDNHNMQGSFISSDGKYILANEILGRIGDGVGETNIGLVVYDVKKSKLIEKIVNKNGFYITDAKMSLYEDGCFLLYASLFKDIFTSDDFISLILVIDPNKRRLYQKKIEETQKTIPILRLKSETTPEGVDISTFDVLHF